MICFPRRGWRQAAALAALLALGIALAAGRIEPPAPKAEAPRTVLELQPFRQTTSISIRSGAGREGTATLVNLNPAINAWHLLTIAWKGGPALSYHLENAKPKACRLLLDEKYPSGIVIAEGDRRYSCDLFGAEPNALDQARRSRLVYAPLCDSRAYLRNPAAGHRTALEAATEFVRGHVWGGENIIAIGHYLMGDAHRETGRVQAAAAAPSAPAGAPLAASINPEYANTVLASGELGIAWDHPEGTGLAPGAWYPATGNPGIFVSILQPNFIAPAILASHKSLVNNLDRVEASSLCYLIAVDLSRYELGYELGTEHPRVDWSDHMLAQMRSPGLPGPDGIKSIAPLVPAGLIAPQAAAKTVATFTGGFKRIHGAFKYGELALKNHGSHYGFIENGVVLSTLQPGLATILVLDDGLVDLKTWQEADNRLLPRIRHARQNGVPVVEFDEASQASVPGPSVGRWGPGNWSGSQDRKLRTMRSGIALQQSNGKRYLVYAVFSDATPSAMARVFQAYRCRYALLLDMNALEHTYLALYRRSGPDLAVDHLLRGMGQLDQTVSGRLVPRFLGYPDNRDFFYLTRRDTQENRP